MTDNIGQIDSKFRYIIVAAKRTRQLQGGSNPLVQSLSKKFTRIAQEEVAAGVVNFEILGGEPQDDDEALPIEVGPAPH